MGIVHRYILRNLFPPFLINLGFFTFVFLMTRILEISDMVVNYRVSLVVVFQMFLYTTPFFLQFVIPMSVMMAVLLTFLQMSSDNEIVALKASGVSVYAMLPPVLVFASIGMLLTGAIALFGLPNGRMAIKQLLYTVATTNTEIGLKERMFTDSFKGVMLYVNRIDPAEKTLYNIFIEDNRSSDLVSTVVAPKGRIFNQPGVPVFHLRMYDGTINQVELASRSAHTVQFDTYDLRLNLEQVIPAALQGPKHVEEMSLGELRESIRKSTRKDDRYYMALMEFHKKFSMPFSCLALGILAIPLGIQSRLAKKSFGVGLGMVFFLMYYILLSLGWVFGESGVYPPLIGMWVPNLVMGGIGVALLRLTARERSVGIDRLVYAARTLRHRVFIRRNGEE